MDEVIGDRFYITLIQTNEGVVWDLRSGPPDDLSVRVKNGVGHSYAAAAYQASNALDRWALDRS